MKVICINDDYDNRLVINRLYLAIAHTPGLLYHIYDEDEKYIGYFPGNLFKKIKQIRNERLNDLI